MTRQARIVLLAVVALAGTLAVVFRGPIAQEARYHVFADGRALFGVPNFGNVASNLPFLLVGVLGLRALARGAAPGVLPGLSPAFGAFFAGTALTALGSAAYHADPSDATLLWDRLPMTSAFMAFLAILLGERIAPRLGARLLVPLLAAGILSIAHWRLTGDLRSYVLVQYLPIALAPLVLSLFPSPLGKPWLLWAVLGAYGVAKAFEALDGPILKLLGVVSGHTLKHVAAAFGTWIVVLAATRREAKPSSI